MLTLIAHIECDDLPNRWDPQEFKIASLERKLRDLELYLLNRTYQEKDSIRGVIHLSDWKKTALEKAKLLEGISQSEWERLKKVVDEAFEWQKRELERGLRLSSETAERVTKSAVF